MTVFLLKRLWRLLAEQALEALDLGMAEKAFVMSGKDAYRGVRLVKRLRAIPDRSVPGFKMFRGGIKMLQPVAPKGFIAKR